MAQAVDVTTNGEQQQAKSGVVIRAQTGKENQNAEAYGATSANVEDSVSDDNRSVSVSSRGEVSKANEFAGADVQTVQDSRSLDHTSNDAELVKSMAIDS